MASQQYLSGLRGVLGMEGEGWAGLGHLLTSESMVESSGREMEDEGWAGLGWAVC